MVHAALLLLMLEAAKCETSFHHQPEAQHPKIFSYPQARRPITPSNDAKSSSKPLISLIGAPEGIRTPDLCLRRAALYPAELRARNAFDTPFPADLKML